MPLSYASATASTSAAPAQPVTAAAAAAPAPAQPVTAAAQPVTAAAQPVIAAAPAPAPAPVREPSLCIARLPNEMSSDGVVMSVIGSDMGYGKIKKVDMIQKTDRNGVEYMMAFIHFEEWANTEDVMSDRNKLMNGEKIKVVYDDDNGRYFTLARRFTKPREEIRRKGTNMSPRYGSTHGSRENHFNRNKKNGERSKPYIDTEGWTTMPTYADSKSSPVKNDAAEETKKYEGDRTNNFLMLDSDSD